MVLAEKLRPLFCFVRKLRKIRTTSTEKFEIIKSFGSGSGHRPLLVLKSMWFENLRTMYDENEGNTQVLYFVDMMTTFSSFTAAPEIVEFLYGTIYHRTEKEEAHMSPLLMVCAVGLL